LCMGMTQHYTRQLLQLQQLTKKTGSRWGDVGLGRGCCGSLHHQRPSVESSTVTSLLQDLSLGEASAAAASSPSTAPPSKRQCRSLSCSEDLGGCRSAWRPHGSGVWTAVAKRRCHSGGSVQRGFATGGTRCQQPVFPAMQRSSSFSLPARSNTLSLDLPGFTPSPSYFSEPPRPFLYLSHEQICLPEIQGGPASPRSSPDCTPEMKRHAGQGGLARSRSQPCVLNDKKMGMKRRRPADSHKQRPSLDLAKMTQSQPHSVSQPHSQLEDLVC
uniref:Family with sequence similarity 53 member B n=1 Tax=Hucho hucho TaxID=62062 RepID=A0A4W5JGK3_9TELE